MDPRREEREPLPLEYFREHEPARRRGRRLSLAAALLAIAWAPFVCGIINATAVTRSYSPEVLSAHRSGSLLFMLLGIVFSLVGLVLFARMRHAAGIVAASAVLLVQVIIAGCTGIVSR